MKFSCTKENLAQALALVGGITGKSVSLPILNNVLLRVEEQRVVVVATNLELAVSIVVRSKVEVAGAFTVPARTLAEFVNLLPNEKIELALVGNELVVSCGKSTTKIKGTSAEEYPIIPTVESGNGFSVGAAEFKTALNQVLPAVARNEIRPELSGIFFGFNNNGNKQLVLAATDSYRLAEKRLALQQGTEEVKVVVPGRTAQEIAHTLTTVSGVEAEPNVRLLMTENQLAVRYGGVEIISRLVEGTYPDYSQIIPKEFKTTITVSVESLKKEIKAAGLFTTSGVNAVAFAVHSAEQKLSLTSASLQTGEYSSEVDAEIVGEDNNILLNHRYLLDGLNNMSVAAVKIKIISADSPCILSPEGDSNYLYIVMPIRQ